MLTPTGFRKSTAKATQDEVDAGTEDTKFVTPLTLANKPGGSGGSGDVSSNTSTSVDSEIAIFSNTTGKVIKRGAFTGILKGTSGVVSAITPGTGVETALAAATNATGGLVTANGTATLTNKTLTSPVLTTPAIGTPSAGVLTSCTGLPVSTGISGLGTGVATALAVNVGTAGAPVVLNGAGGTPSSITLTNGTGLPVGGVSATGTPSSSTYLRGDGTWNSPSGSGDVTAATSFGTDGLPIVSDGTGKGVKAVSTISAATVTTLTVTNAVSSLPATVIELGHASDTTISRVSAGKIAIEGVNVVTTSSTDTMTNKTLTSPTLTTPVLGTPSSGTLTSCTGLPISTGVSGLGTGVATFLATPSSANLISAVTDETGSGALVFATSPTLVTPALGTPASGNLSSCTADGTNAVGFRHLPQNSQSAAYTTVLADAGKHILHPAADTTARTFTIDSNANVAYPLGTAITFINENSAGVMTIAITSDTMRLAGAGTTGSRTLAANGVATAIKITTTSWIISGTGLT